MHQQRIQNKFQMHDHYINSQLIHFPLENYENGSESYFQKNREPSAIQQDENSEAQYRNFLSAIPYARLSKRVKRKPNYPSFCTTAETSQKQKTYFPFEFVGHATRQSKSSLDDCRKRENEEFHSTMITAHAVRQPSGHGVSLQHTCTNPSETPLRPGKRTKSNSTRRRPTSKVALEKHIEQIHRKHAEFNWEIPDSQRQKGCTSNEICPSDMDIQRVPTTPFDEQCTPPSLYSSFEKLHRSRLPWLSTPTSSTYPSLNLSNIHSDQSRRKAVDWYFKDETWSSITANEEKFHRAPDNDNTERHLYPY